MHQPLLEPAVLLSENCPECKGTGGDGGGCERCDGSGRELREVPLSEVWEMAQAQHARLTAPPPSALREGTHPLQNRGSV